MMREVFCLGSTGCQPVAFGGLTEGIFAQSPASEPLIRARAVRGKLPRATGQRPVLPGTRNAAAR
jgi:hypothetical protein